ncbi:hypothetical protein BJX63DRAFT_431599 [Aspergillus granulosus]|uniref:Uncharacterized protein n=1 Tax=Aspergillus granulosus TaxID=176169 RepID=A0ABR4HF54_9EURO
MEPAVPSQVDTAYTWEVEIENRKGKTSRTTLQVTKETMNDASRNLWNITRKNLSRKDKVLIDLGLLSVRISNTPIPRPSSQAPCTTDAAATTFLSLKNLDNLELSAFLDMSKEMNVGHYSIRFTLIEKRPFVFKFGRIAALLLAIGLQIGLSLVTL